MRYRPIKHVTAPLPSTYKQTPHGPSRNWARTSEFKRRQINSRTPKWILHTRGEKTATDRPTVYPGIEPGFPRCETGRTMTQPRALKGQVTKRIRTAYRARPVYICRGDFMFSFSPTCFLPSPSQARLYGLNSLVAVVTKTSCLIL